MDADADLTDYEVLQFILEAGFLYRREGHADIPGVVWAWTWSTPRSSQLVAR